MTFLNKLISEQKIKLIESSDIIKESYLAKSKSSMESAEILLKTFHLDEATSMVYYSMYYSVLALFFKIGIKCENHTGAILLLNQLLEKKDLSNILLKAKEERIDKQYYTDYKITKDEFEEFIIIAQDFIINIKSIIQSLTEFQIKTLKTKFKDFN